MGDDFNDVRRVSDAVNDFWRDHSHRLKQRIGKRNSPVLLSGLLGVSSLSSVACETKESGFNLKALFIFLSGSQGFLFFLHARFFVMFPTSHFRQNSRHLNLFFKPAEGGFEILIIFNPNFWHDLYPSLLDLKKIEPCCHGQGISDYNTTIMHYIVSYEFCQFFDKKICKLYPLPQPGGQVNFRPPKR